MTQPAKRIGGWVQTWSGRAFYPLDPRPEDLDIGDIAHALSYLCRFGGHCTHFYSVAEHCVRVSRAIEDHGGTREEAFAGLMHDAAEAYIGDMTRPLKQAPELAGYKLVEQLIEAAIAERFRLPRVMPPIVKRFDLVLLSTEKRDLMDAFRAESLGAWDSDSIKALPGRIEPYTRDCAMGMFLGRFVRLSEDYPEAKPPLHPLGFDSLFPRRVT